MWFMDYIVEYLTDARDWFLDAYYEVNGWVFPFYYLATPLYYLYIAFYYLAFYFGQFNSWLDWALAMINQILSWSTIWSYILSYVPNLTQIRDWFYNWTANVTSTVTTWWSATQNTVLAWVQGARDFATSLFNQVTNALASLQVAWDSFKGRIPSIDQVLSWWGNWWGNILSQLGTWWNSRLLEVQGLINSAFIARGSFWSGWQEIRDKVLEFFTDPVEYIWERFADWFLGPEG